MDPIGSFTGSQDEAAFYHVPVLIEAEGGKLVPLLLDAIAAGEAGDETSMRTALTNCSMTIVQMGAIMPKLYPNIDAHYFYHDIRPFLAGGKGMEEKGLPKGMVFKLSDGSERCVKCVGGSAVQSALFPFIDYGLGVEHQPPKAGADESIFKVGFQCSSAINSRTYLQHRK